MFVLKYYVGRNTTYEASSTSARTKKNFEDGVRSVLDDTVPALMFNPATSLAITSTS